MYNSVCIIIIENSLHLVILIAMLTALQMLSKDFHVTIFFSFSCPFEKVTVPFHMQLT